MVVGVVLVVLCKSGKWKVVVGLGEGEGVVLLSFVGIFDLSTFLYFQCCTVKEISRLLGFLNSFSS